MSRKLSRPLATAVAAAVLAGCSSSPTPTSTQAVVTYAPAAYGVTGHCYYIDYPAEATALIAAGLCPAAWLPTRAPLSWEQEYADYYDSDAYVDDYVPATDRVSYRSTQTAFYTKYKITIITAEKTAVYKSSTGATVKGYTGSAMKFSGGNGSTAQLGGGSARGGTSIHGCSLNDTVIALRTGSNSGGSARGGTSLTSTTRPTTSTTLRPTPRPTTSKGC